MDKTRRVGRYRSAVVATALSQIYLVPENDELLSSYLVRRAHCQGLSPHRFTTRALPGVAVWNRDIDSSLSSTTLTMIAKYCALSESAVRAMTLYDLMGCESSAVPDWRHYQRWINAVGIYHRMRKRFGLQYCPICLGAAPVFRRRWRLAFAFFCPEHSVRLRDSCPSCAMPVMLHRCKFDATRCWKCGASLCTGASSDNIVTPAAMDLQQRLMVCVDNEFIPVGAELVSHAQFVHGAVRVLRVMKEHMHSHPALWPFGENTKPIHHELRFLRSSERFSLFSVLIEVLDDWPINFLHFAWAAGITQLAFRHCHNAPRWLRAVIETLPARLRSRNEFSQVNFVRYIRRLERDGGTKSRSVRAQALMQAAKGQYGD